MGIMTETKIVMKDISEIKPYVRNPRRNEKTVELLTELIPKVGFNVPLVIDENGIIVKGHARYTAAIRLGMKQVPCIVSHASEEAIKVDRITDNKIAEYSEWINGAVYDEIESINTDIDFDSLGFPKVEFNEMPVKPMLDSKSHEDDEPETQELKAPVKRKYYKFVCKVCGQVMFIPEDTLKRSE